MIPICKICQRGIGADEDWATIKVATTKGENVTMKTHRACLERLRYHTDTGYESDLLSLMLGGGQLKRSKLEIITVKIASGMDLVGKELKAKEVRQPPRFTHIFGRTWQSIGSTDKDEPIFSDTTWGHYGYFRRNNKWFRFNIQKRGSQMNKRA
jgi:hypothetical protein